MEEGDAFRDEFSSHSWLYVTQEENSLSGTTIGVLGTDRPRTTISAKVEF